MKEEAHLPGLPVKKTCCVKSAYYMDSCYVKTDHQSKFMQIFNI